ncbi:hypothetical protein DBR36_03540 [Microbacterium sp. HMWF026]|uniref:hypothetical protein n=1 Tax=Microbacterium sp. HMWF026 TaxID=2056861 RepID=UPI000D382D9D|nr:hypothetical protein [Microbacterium sp. HMWF026]PTT21732.1 hypothetical protein DBR36_03540 [Microbacterium sp. HMWF026]
MNLATLKASASAAARKSYTVKNMAVAVLTLGILAPLAVLFTTSLTTQESADPIEQTSIRLIEEALPVAQSIDAPSNFEKATVGERAAYTMAVLDAMQPFDETDSAGRAYSVLPLTDDSGQIVFCVAVEDGEDLHTYGTDPFCN